MLFGIRKGKERLETFSSLRFDVPELTWTAPCLHFVYSHTGDATPDNQIKSVACHAQLHDSSVAQLVRAPH